MSSRRMRGSMIRAYDVSRCGEGVPVEGVRILHQSEQREHLRTIRHGMDMPIMLNPAST